MIIVVLNDLKQAKVELRNYDQINIHTYTHRYIYIQPVSHSGFEISI